MSTRAALEKSFRIVPGVVGVELRDEPGRVHVLLDWVGSDLRAATVVASRVACRNVVAGVAWQVDIRAWRWRWLRGATRWLGWRRWPERLATVRFEDVVRRA